VQAVAAARGVLAAATQTPRDLAVEPSAPAATPWWHWNAGGVAPGEPAGGAAVPPLKDWPVAEVAGAIRQVLHTMAQASAAAEQVTSQASGGRVAELLYQQAELLLLLLHVWRGKVECDLRIAAVGGRAPPPGPGAEGAGEGVCVAVVRSLALLLSGPLSASLTPGAGEEEEERRPRQGEGARGGSSQVVHTLLSCMLTALAQARRMSQKPEGCRSREETVEVRGLHEMGRIVEPAIPRLCAMQTVPALAIVEVAMGGRVLPEGSLQEMARILLHFLASQSPVAAPATARGWARAARRQEVALKLCLRMVQLYLPTSAAERAKGATALHALNLLPALTAFASSLLAQDAARSAAPSIPPDGSASPKVAATGTEASSPWDLLLVVVATYARVFGNHVETQVEVIRFVQVAEQYLLAAVQPLPLAGDAAPATPLTLRQLYEAEHALFLLQQLAPFAGRWQAELPHSITCFRQAAQRLLCQCATLPSTIDASKPHFYCHPVGAVEEQAARAPPRLKASLHQAPIPTGSSLTSAASPHSPLGGWFNTMAAARQVKSTAAGTDAKENKPPDYGGSALVVSRPGSELATVSPALGNGSAAESPAPVTAYSELMAVRVLAVLRHAAAFLCVMAPAPSYSGSGGGRGLAEGGEGEDTLHEAQWQALVKICADMRHSLRQAYSTDSFEVGGAVIDDLAKMLDATLDGTIKAVGWLRYLQHER
ncbi:hypothetical protein CYMTET_29238, partial [Cymbomonas tetramitiformis]